LDATARERLARLAGRLEAVDNWSEAALEEAVRAFADAENVKLGQVAQPLRAALSGSSASPGIFEIGEILGREETLGRLEDVISA
jgi:glutamyl-tRNA synthetase